tara:strand:+ start:2071 stop:2478 length:408 start_codon:yes stop_codon:yes gene_type:complete
MIKLCYKEYPFKISLASCKSFFDATGEDLQSVLLSYLDICQSTQGESLIGRMSEFHKVCKFETASHAIHSLVKAENKNIPLEEIQDAMFRVSWLPSERDDDLSEPWPLVMVTIANQVNDYFAKNMPVKKKGIEAE